MFDVRLLTRLMFVLAILFAATAVGRAADPGIDNPNDPALRLASQANDQKKGSVLFYTFYTSSATNPILQNTRVAITNTHPTRPVAIHLFFVDGASCSPSDRYVCLTQNQTLRYLTSEQDPGITGYVVAIATDFRGLPIAFDWLIGDEFVKTEAGYFGNLGAEAISVSILPLLNFISAGGSLSTVFFDAICYNRVPRVLAVDNIPSRADGNDTLIVIDAFGGDLSVGARTIGRLFGLLFDDGEGVHSFTSPSLSCQFVSNLTNNFPRTTPRFELVIPAGQTGWMKFWSTNAAETGLFGAVFNRNGNALTAAGAFQGAHNMHKLTLTPSASFIVPIFPPNCGFVREVDGDGGETEKQQSR